jgi:hypothetical protein
MFEPNFVVGEEVVFCPKRDEIGGRTRVRGASGVIISRQVVGSKENKRVKSVLVKWRSHRKGVSCFRICGQKRVKSDLMTAYFTGKRNLAQFTNGEEEVSRYEEEAKNIHSLSYCSDCPLRLQRLVGCCPMDRKEAVATNGMGYPGCRKIRK